jgi:predicted AAA+ superfamily ATPase
MSKPHKRYLTNSITMDLGEKVVLLGGPRQVGKTTLALQFLTPSTKKNENYLSWDALADRSKILKFEFSPEQVVIFDEIQKFKNWRNLVKSFYDKLYPEKNLLVTGSAKLDFYKRGGDSMIGRYFYYRLHPLSLHEVGFAASDLDQLLKFGGFPEPFYKGNPRFLKRWQNEIIEKLIREDVKDLENIKDLSSMELLSLALPDRVGSPLSINSLREDLSVSFDTVERWVQILERLFLVFRILPFGAPKIRAVKKERKLYFWNWSFVENPGSRWENLVASHLLKYCDYFKDVHGEKMELRFLRDFDGREIDFVIIQNGRPKMAIECKTGERSPTPWAAYFRTRTNIPEFYQVHQGQRDYGHAHKDIRVMPFTKFCSEILLLKDP